MEEQILDVILEKIRRDYDGDIAIFAIYGSYVRGDAHENSDIDFYFVPKTKKGYELHTGFILDGIGYDLWPLSWAQLESFADYKGMVSIIADAKAIYYESEADLNRFKELQNRARKPLDVDFSGEARQIIRNCKESFFDLISSLDFSFQKETAVKIVGDLVRAVALINKTYTHSGWGKSLVEIAKLSNIPTDFLELLDEVVCAESGVEITNATRLLLSNTEDLLPKDQNKCDFQNDFTLFYEEAKSLYNKLYNACDRNDRSTALMAGVSLQSDIASITVRKTYKDVGFPDIVSGFHFDRLPEYKKTVQQHERCLAHLLTEHGVKINIYDSFEDFKNQFLKDEDQ